LSFFFRGVSFFQGRESFAAAARASLKISAYLPNFQQRDGAGTVQRWDAASKYRQPAAIMLNLPAKSVT